MIYVIGWLILYIAFLMTAITGNRNRSPTFIVFVCFAFIASLRGSVGTDTNTYEMLVTNISDQNIWGGVEPGFYLLVSLFGWVIDSPVLIVRVLSLSFFVLAFILLANTSKNERYFVLVYLVPAFFYQYSMNTLRLGFASILILLAIQSFRVANIKKSCVLAAFSLMFHYSSAFSLLYLYAMRVRWLSIRNICYFIVLVVISLALILLNYDYFYTKVLSYVGFESPSLLSGMSKIAVICVLLVSIFFSTIESVTKTKMLSAGLFFVILFWLLSGYSYAGLRFLDLLSFSLPISILVTFDKSNKQFDASIMIGLFIAGFISMIFNLRSYLLEEGIGPSPFLPYSLTSLF